MEAIKFKTLTQEKDIEYFLSRFEGYVGVKLPYDYAQRSTFVAGYKGDEMVGGYMLVTKPEFRSLMFVPDDVRESHEFFRNEAYDMMEINGVWMSASLKTASEQFSIWLKLILDAFKCRKQFVLLMANQRNINIRHVHAMTGAKDIYEGAPMLMSGDKSHSTIRVSYTTRWSLLLNVPRYWFEYKSRERRFHRRLKQRAYSRVASRAS
ncbi:hypothetical protein QGM61_11635 [Pseudohongiella sp. SYSU M77423]|uniref:hypothetical protein n=1 Tax=unclassified Pseudohongiella TaxID=2629611 RepID=UPI000C3B3CCE|nr:MULTISPECIES: hypothetical protein [unclassified Pseudohongiella]MAY56649.1 hypothetical protein [Gammaproteobacteria bacterium]MEC8858620.1 hypothetical protein [Pseudomonadota bacterium]HBN13493.1 hypothetical protein [Pseudohongiella sp.]MBJ55202.1 hypothetical protein [Gammaproteobacteria bacterium]MDH7944474.1 hypothetical protein [Pseudohongiella sp. SYSU M77423]|tara:strand:+ start:1747 stop:2370 length:624 start_codon:yes stop_codon:yes gene_type:complete